jgi:glycerol kinase
MKITYGTGCFLLSNIGNEPKYKDAFVTTVMYQK